MPTDKKDDALEKDKSAELERARSGTKRALYIRKRA